MQATERQKKNAEPQVGEGRGLLAAALSLIVPGAGHLLIRRWGRAAIWFAGWILVVGASGSSHNAAVIVLMAVAAVDAFVFARSDAQAASERPGAKSDEA